MPPRVKKTPARAAKSSRKKQIPPEEKTDEASVSVSVSVAEAKEEIKVVEEVVQQKENKLKPSKPQVESKSEPNGSLPAKEEEGVNDAFDDDGKGERLELDDNDVEYEPEEETGGDYYEVEIENEDGQEGDEGEEEEGDVADVGEEDVDMVDEEMEGDGDEGEEDAENAEEHDDIVEEEEHHEVVNERRKRKEFEVFVGGLDKDASEEDLRKVFSSVGEVTEVRLMMNPQTRKNKGFAFLRFATVEQAKRAVSELKNPVVKGKQCGVTPSQDNDTLFLGNICKTWTKEALKEKLKHYGVEKVEDLTLVEDTSNKGLNRGFAFLEFSSRNDAMNAYKCLTKRDVVFGVDRTAKVSFADSFVEPDDEIMAKVKTVFVDGLPASWDEDRVKALLKKFGEIENVDLARNMPSAKRKDFGFVTFDTHDAAVACAAGINNAELGEGAKKVKVRARLSRPLQRGRVRRGVLEDHRFGRGISRGGRGSWVHAPLRRIPGQSSSGLRGYGAPSAARGFKRPFGGRDRRPIIAVPERARHFPPPARSYNQRPPVGPSYPKSSSKRDFSRRGEVTPRSRAAVGYGSRIAAERRSSYRDEAYPSRGSGYSDVAPRSASRTAATAYVDEGYGQRIERVPPSYREGRGHDYDSLSGSKRPYSALDEAPSRYTEAPSRYADAPSRYADASVRGSRAHLDYGYSGTASQYGDAYSERLGRSHIGYGGRSSYTGEESSGLYSSRQGMGYGGSVSSSDVGGMYSSSYGSDYLSRGPDVGGSSYSSLYSDRGLSGSGYLGSSGSGSYY
ncbi:hypothetical protein MRB53_002973 [Persea americana]|uniref:Uncharacterized protein n=1 Tax=Persea americana TaxID=3435 RepID=A0ACC2MWC4_PERAE|nr:hypothetical protein MRB53_002973 [Persea americana]|eukprot:TRINITY_DN1170_c0_g1_i2.p1 TRINITY_DN1170_c0_g1~~TRINITY_DN1170_c0_g1_i2.p1  ORF type:complete len:789 (-),score=229.54 TRINITY_DN1170_c0_g1_i2:1347-3713(-)